MGGKKLSYTYNTFKNHEKFNISSRHMKFKWVLDKKVAKSGANLCTLGAQWQKTPPLKVLWNKWCFQPNTLFWAIASPNATVMCPFYYFSQINYLKFARGKSKETIGNCKIYYAYKEDTKESTLPIHRIN